MYDRYSLLHTAKQSYRSALFTGKMTYFYGHGTIQVEVDLENNCVDVYYKFNDQVNVKTFKVKDSWL